MRTEIKPEYPARHLAPGLSRRSPDLKMSPGIVQHQMYHQTLNAMVALSTSACGGRPKNSPSEATASAAFLLEQSCGSKYEGLGSLGIEPGFRI